MRRRVTVLLGGKPDDQTDQRAGQDDLEVVATLHQRDQKREERADQESKYYSERQRVKLLRKKPDRDAGDDSLHRRAKYDTRQLIADGRREPCGKPVDRAEDGAEYHSNKWFRHVVSPFGASCTSWLLILLLNVAGDFFNCAR